MSLELKKLTDNLYVIPGLNKGRFPFAHSFLVRDDLCVLIDTGCGLEALREIRESFPLDLIINSHGHADHCSGNWLFPDIPLYAPIEGADSHGRLGPLSQRFLGSNNLCDRWQDWIRGMMGFVDRSPTNFFSEGHVFDFGKLKLKAIHTPGHTCDHYCFVEEDNNILLSFDIDLTAFGPWYGNPESNLNDFRRSIEIVRNLAPRMIASSHLLPISSGIKEALKVYTAVLDKREKKIAKLISPGIDKVGLVNAAPIYQRHTQEPELFRFFEGRMIDLHLEELIGKQEVRLEKGQYYLVNRSLNPLG
jgi:glyoxylase-like metal-dependent hydrolase (beta-lactamase superfamily II)